MRKKRRSFFDILRFIGAFSVVLLHLSAQYLVRSEPLSGPWLTYGAYVGLNRWGVPIFTMISGALLLRRVHTPADLARRMGRMLALWIVWSVIYSAFACLRRGAPDRSWQGFVNGLFQTTHLWYLPMLAGVYAVMPLLRKITESPRLTRYFLLLWLIFGLLLPRFGTLLAVLSPVLSSRLDFAASSLRLYFPLGFTGYFVLGAVLAESAVTPRLERWAYILGALSTVYMYAGTALLSQHMGETCLLIYDDLSLPAALQGIAVFVLIRKRINLKGQPQEIKAFFSRLSQWSLGVYLIHPLIIDLLALYLGLTPKIFHPALSIPLLGLAVGMISFALSGLFGLAAEKIKATSARGKNVSA